MFPLAHVYTARAAYHGNRAVLLGALLPDVANCGSELFTDPQLHGAVKRVHECGYQELAIGAASHVLLDELAADEHATRKNRYTTLSELAADIYIANYDKGVAPLVRGLLHEEWPAAALAETFAKPQPAVRALWRDFGSKVELYCDVVELFASMPGLYRSGAQWKPFFERAVAQIVATQSIGPYLQKQ